MAGRLPACLQDIYSSAGKLPSASGCSPLVPKKSKNAVAHKLIMKLEEQWSSPVPTVQLYLQLAPAMAGRPKRLPCDRDPSQKPVENLFL